MASRRAVLLPIVVGALALVFGFGTASATGNRAIGGVILLLGAAWCAWRLWPVAGPARTIGSVTVFAAAFAISHPLGAIIGAWPAVLLVSAAAAAVDCVVCAGRVRAM